MFQVLPCTEVLLWSPLLNSIAYGPKNKSPLLPLLFPISASHISRRNNLLFFFRKRSRNIALHRWGRGGDLLQSYCYCEGGEKSRNMWEFERRSKTKYARLGISSLAVKKNPKKIPFFLARLFLFFGRGKKVGAQKVILVLSFSGFWIVNWNESKVSVIKSGMNKKWNFIHSFERKIIFKKSSMLLSIHGDLRK